MPMPSASYFAKRRVSARLAAESRRPEPKPYIPPTATSVIELADKQRRPCPKCQTKMIVRSARDRRVFWSCPRYPICKGSAPIDQRKFQAELARRARERLGL